MTFISEFIASGILELYVMGIASDDEIWEVEQLAATYEEVRLEIDQISHTLEAYANKHAAQPGPYVKPLLMATIDYVERIQGGEEHLIPPVVNDKSVIADFATWLNRADMSAPENFGDIFVKIIGYTPKATTAVVWINKMVNEEVHQDEYESFLIVDGTCDLVVGGETHKLVAGDYFPVPLNIKHQMLVTSSAPCKAILQRIAVS